MKIISAEDIAKVASWPLVIEAIRAGHRRPRAALGDTLLSSGNRRILVRSTWIAGYGPGLKAATIFPDNPGRRPPMPSVQGPVILFDDETGSVSALLDGPEVTKWKTAADSALGADLLAAPDVTRLVMVGAGAMAGALIRAHLSVRPSITLVTVWNRTAARARELARSLGDLAVEVAVSDDLEAALRDADIVSSATMSETPLVRGAWLKPGAHVDLVGAYTPAMREADDEALRRSRIFVDCFDTAVDHIGELNDPIARGVIARGDVLDDLYGLVAGKNGRRSDTEITLFKNGGGAHLDLMVSHALAIEAKGTEVAG
jgi:ornithine cyclodeaminase/alanine dehydrogenase-like protein (mu-crystallin family)